MSIDEIDFGEIDFGEQADFEITENFDAFEIDLSGIGGIGDDFSTKYIKPKLRPEIKTKNLKYKNAQSLARDIGIGHGLRAMAVVDGSFIFGDFIEAWITENRLFIRNMYITTLSMSEENIDSLINLLEWNCVKNMSLLVSAYFFSHERNGMIKLLYKNMEKYGDRFQLAAASSHTKTIAMETHDGLYYTIHGSANLRSSSNLEQFVLEEGQELHDFFVDYQKNIIDVYKTIDHPVRRNKLWQAVQNSGQNITPESLAAN